MRKLIAAATALALLLGACAATPPEPTTPAQGESHGITWRTLDLDDEANTELRAWIEQAYERWLDEINQDWPRQEFPAGDVVVFNRGYGDGGPDDGLRVIMRDAAGEETVFLQSRQGPYPHESAGPMVRTVFNERYLLVHWSDWTWLAEQSLFDMQTMQEYPIAFDFEFNGDFVLYREQRGNTLFWENRAYGAPVFGQLHLFATDLATLPNPEFTDLLANIPHEPVRALGQTLLCPAERYYIATDDFGLYIFDLREQSVFHLPKDALGFEMGGARDEIRDWDWTQAYLQKFLLRDDNTLIWFSDFPNPNLLNMSIAVELTLP